ncbi:unnamed protein product [Ixodes pacificus]
MLKGRHKKGHSLLPPTNFVVVEKIQSAAIRAGPTASRRGRRKRKPWVCTSHCCNVAVNSTT